MGASQEHTALPRVLVISFNSFLSSNANGRTLMNLFSGWQPEKLAQFYMSSDYPDFTGCGSYFRVTDSEALRALMGKKVGKPVAPAQKQTEDHGAVYTRAKANRQNQAVRYIRQLIWQTCCWWRKEFDRWVDSFDPELILLFSGNNAFIDKIALKLAKRRNIPVVLYNCEDYFFKPPKTPTLFAKINKKYCDRAFRKTMAQVSGVIYNSGKLEATVTDRFGSHNSIVLMNPAGDFSAVKADPDSADRIAYLGNVAVGREVSLCAMADALAKHGRVLHVYGNANSEEAKAVLTANSNILYHGAVSYEDCCAIMKGCRLLVHTESFDDRRKVDLRHAFTTKVADSFACGTPLLVYAPGDMAVTEYIRQTEAAALACSAEELEEKLQMLLQNTAYAEQLVRTAQKTAEENHSMKKTAARFAAFLHDCIS